MNRNKSKPANDVNGGLDSYQPASSGRGRHGRQVTPGRHQATGRTNMRKHSLKIATWNVRTLYKKGKLDLAKQEMDRMKINILGLSAVRWTGSGIIPTDDKKIIYSGGDSHERGVGIIFDLHASRAITGYWAISDRVLLVKMKGQPFDITIIQVYAPTSESSDEDIDQFYADMEKAKRISKSQEILIIMGDFNAKVGNEKHEDIVGNFGLGERNERGERLIEWAQVHDMVIGNTWFAQHPRRLWTWQSPGDRVRNQIDYILISKRFRNALISTKTRPGADCESDHVPVVSRIRLKLKKLRTKKVPVKLDLALLKENQEIQNNFAIKVENKFQALTNLNDVENKWEALKQSINEAASEVIPQKRKETKRKWMKKEILEMMEKRRKLKTKPEEYKIMHQNIQKACNLAKEEWLEEQCSDIEINYLCKNSKIMHEKIKDMTGRKGTTSTGCLRSADGKTLVEKSEKLARWSEYIGDLYDDASRNENFQIEGKLEGPTILADEVREAIKHIRHGKATGPDNISIEMIAALENFGIVQLTTILNQIYETGNIPEDLLKSIFVTLPKRPGTIDCELHRTISLMSHVTKILLRIIMMRSRNKIRPEIAAEQCGFVEGKGTANAIFMLRTIIERALEMQTDLYLCFIDNTKAFDCVKHQEIVNLLKGINVDGKDLRIIRNMYWQQTAAVRIEDEISDFRKIKKGVRQGCDSPLTCFPYTVNI